MGHPLPNPPTPLLFHSMQWNQYDNALSFFFNSIIGQWTEHIASHYIVPRHIESTILRLSNSWYPTTSTTPNTYCPACRTSLIATRFWVVMICPISKCLTVLEFSFILFDLCLFITIFNFILNYVPIVTFWILTYHKIWILLIIFCFIWSYWIIYFLTSLEVFWSVVS